MSERAVEGYRFSMLLLQTFVHVDGLVILLLAWEVADDVVSASRKEALRGSCILSSHGSCWNWVASSDCLYC
jgi:hypothetical protein